MAPFLERLLPSYAKHTLFPITIQTYALEPRESYIDVHDRCQGRISRFVRAYTPAGAIHLQRQLAYKWTGDKVLENANRCM